MRQCINCWSDQTSINNNGSEMWYKHKDGHLCKKCHLKLIGNPKRTSEYNKKYNIISNKKWNPINNPINSPRMLLFKCKRILLKEKPRTGYCEQCSNNIFDKSCKRTSIHHVKYDEYDPLKYTIELCNSCHQTLHLLIMKQ